MKIYFLTVWIMDNLKFYKEKHWEKYFFLFTLYFLTKQCRISVWELKTVLFLPPPSSKDDLLKNHWLTLVYPLEEISSKATVLVILPWRGKIWGSLTWGWPSVAPFYAVPFSSVHDNMARCCWSEESSLSVHSYQKRCS